MKRILLTALSVPIFCLSPVRAQQLTRSTSPRVSVNLSPAPAQLKAMLKSPFILSCGTTGFGNKANPIWAVSLSGPKSGKNDRLEFWQQEKHGGFHLLRRIVLPPLAAQPLSTRSLKPSDDTENSIQLRWLFPLQRRGPVIISRAGEGLIVYAFEKGWQNRHPIVQQLNSYEGNNYNFDSVDQNAVLQGERYIFYHMTSPEDEPGETYRAFWKSGFGWRESAVNPQTDPPKYLPELIPR